MKEILINSINFGFIIYSNYESPNTTFFTSNNLPLQFAYMNFKKGEKIKAHIHNKFLREIYQTNEILVLKKGKMKINFYDYNQNLIHHEIINTGDLIFLQEGGHSFEMLEECVFYEIKNGPYFNQEIDKVKF